MKICVKSGLDISGIQPEMVFGVLVCASVFDDADQKFTITSVCDGKHMPSSCHYFGRAFDIRTRDLRGVLAGVIGSRLQEALGSQFQVVVESDHIHVEFVS